MSEIILNVALDRGVQLDTTIGAHTIHTDLPESMGGDDTGPTPFELFLASLGSCIGVFGIKFLQKHKLETTGFGVRVVCDKLPDVTKVVKMTFEISLPADFPEKLHAPLLKTLEQCTVKKHIFEPPEFEVKLV